MKWEALVSSQNLKLAWRRINTGMNLQYKRFYRECFLVYESGVDEHIKNLHKALKAKAWQPQHATRVYLPKPSGLQRPISLLELEDQIVLQAIANLFARKLRNKRQRVELKTVFSNKLSGTKNSIFFMERWQHTYHAFQDKCTEAFNAGYTWSAHFDLSAYYDTISHDLLLAIVSPKNCYPSTSDTLKSWLQVWSADNLSAMTGHGIPQGPVASDFLAEAFFLPIDLRLQEASFRYLRYVDDIRLFGRTENEVRHAAILLEQECRHRGLIPQSSKFHVVELKTAEQAMGSLPSIAPMECEARPDESMTAAEACKLLTDAVAGRPQTVKDKARFRFVMYRAPANAEFLKLVLRLLPRHPEHIDAFVAHFANYAKRVRIARAALDYLESGVPYSYVRGELWHIVARLAGCEELRRALPMARDDARKRARCVVLSWGVMHFLMRCEEKGLARIGRRLASEHPVSRSLLAPIFDDREFLKTGHVKTLLKGTLMEQLSIARQLQNRRVTLNSIGLRQRDLPGACRIALKSLGVIGRLYRHTTTDWIGEILASLYGCEDEAVWRELLGTEYEHALQILVEANVRFTGAYSEWLALQDSFNDIVVRRFFLFLKSHGLGGYSKTQASNGKLVDYGTLISKGQPFDTTYTPEAKALRALHDRRNKLPASHPYHKKGGARNRWLSKRGRDSLVPDAKNAMDGIAAIVKKNI